MNNALERQLTEALDSLEEGLSMDAIVMEDPEAQGEILPLLQTATYIRETFRYVEPATSTGMATGRRRMLEAAAAKRATTASPRWPTALVALRSWFRTPSRSLAVVALLLALLVSVGGLTTSAAASSLPGDLLYPVKRATEQVRLALTVDPAGKALLYSQFNHERQAEAQAVATLGRRAQLQFEGVLQQHLGGMWIVDGIPLLAEPETVGKMPALGSTIIVDVMAPGDGTLHIQHLIVHSQPVHPSGEMPAPQPSATPTAGNAMPMTGHTPTTQPGVMEPEGMTTMPAGRPSPSGMGQPMGPGGLQGSPQPEVTATIMGPGMMGQPTPTAQATQQPSPTSSPPTMMPATMTPQPTQMSQQPGDNHSGGSGGGSGGGGHSGGSGGGSGGGGHSSGSGGGGSSGGGHSGGGGSGHHHR